MFQIRGSPCPWPRLPSRVRHRVRSLPPGWLMRCRKRAIHRACRLRRSRQELARRSIHLPWRGGVPFKTSKTRKRVARIARIQKVDVFPSVATASVAPDGESGISPRPRVPPRRLAVCASVLAQRAGHPQQIPSCCSILASQTRPTQPSDVPNASSATAGEKQSAVHGTRAEHGRLATTPTVRGGR